MVFVGVSLSVARAEIYYQGDSKKQALAVLKKFKKQGQDVSLEKEKGSRASKKVSFKLPNSKNVSLLNQLKSNNITVISLGKNRYFFIVNSSKDLKKWLAKIKKAKIGNAKVTSLAGKMIYTIKKNEEESISFGAQEDKSSDNEDEESPYQYELKLRLEETRLDKVNGSSNLSLVRGNASLNRNFGSELNASLGIRYSLLNESVSDKSFRQDTFTFNKSNVSYVLGDVRFSFGYLSTVWGRLDEISPNDKLSKQDFSRSILDLREERLIPSPSGRIEYFIGNHKLDLVFQVESEGNILPHQDSIWFPVKKTNGQIQGAEPQADLATLLGVGAIVEKRDKGNNFGARYTTTIGSISLGANYIQYIDNNPYFMVNPQYLTDVATSGTLAALAANKDELFWLYYPAKTLMGGDISYSFGNYVIRFEFAKIDNENLTKLDFSNLTTTKTEWGAAVEYTPESTELNIFLQYNSYSYNNSEEVLDKTSDGQLSGRIEYSYNTKLKARLNFSYSILNSDFFLNPELVYEGYDGGEIFLKKYIFDGPQDSFFGFYKNNDIFTIGFKGEL